jgi:hypothetical protein
MTKALEYLEAAKAEEIAEELRMQGFTVTLEPGGADAGYDILADRGGKRLGIAVKARPALAEEAGEIARLRERAREQRMDEFRLVVVNPPRQVDVEIHGLEQILLVYLANHVPKDLETSTPPSQVERVTDCEIQSLEAGREGMRVRGVAILEVKLQYGGGEEGEAIWMGEGFPFTFDLQLDNELKLRGEPNIHVDTSRLSE